MFKKLHRLSCRPLKELLKLKHSTKETQATHKSDSTKTNLGSHITLVIHFNGQLI
jgi:hypothetical protein